MKKPLSLALLLVGFLLGASALSALAQTWSAPGCNPSIDPRACNTPAPLNIGNTEQFKLGPLVLNSTTQDASEVGLTVFGKIKIPDNKGAGKSFISDADGKGAWRDEYQMQCLGWVAGASFDRCCRIHVPSGEVTCKNSPSLASPSGFASSWSSPNTVFSSGAAGPYSLELIEAVAGYRNPLVCRMNAAGSSECKLAGGVGLTSWQLIGPWTSVTANPF